MEESPKISCLLLFLGGRIQPAAITMLQLQPTLVGFIASKDTPQRVGQMQALIARGQLNFKMLTPKYVRPYEPPATRQAIAELLAEAATYSANVAPMLSLTGAPQPMSIAGYDVARQLGCPAYTLDTEAGQLLDLAAEAATTVDLRLKVEDYLNVYGVTLRGTAELSGDAGKLLYAGALAALAARPRTTAELVAWLPQISQLAPPNRLTQRWTLQEPHWQLLCELAQCGVVRELERQSTAQGDIKQGDEVTLGVTSKASARFLEGTWLESYLYSQAQLAENEGVPLFDSSLGGVKLLSEGAEREIDFIGMHRNKALVATCKSGRQPWDKAALDEVVAVAKLFGDDYCMRLFVTSQVAPAPRAKQAPAYAHFLAQAKQAQVVVVTGDQLPELQSILRRELFTPTFGRN